MDNVTFDSETDLAHTAPVQKSSAGITAWLITNKFAKDETQANYILIGVLVTCLVLTGFALMSLFGGESGIDAEERMRLEQSTRPPQ